MKGPRTLIEEADLPFADDADVELDLPFADDADIVDLGNSLFSADELSSWEANVIRLKDRVPEGKLPTPPKIDRDPNRTRPSRTPMPGTPTQGRRRPPSRPRLRHQLARSFVSPAVARAPAARSAARFTERSAIESADASEPRRWPEIVGTAIAALVLIWLFLAN